jgi:hypothetical protein
MALMPKRIYAGDLTVMNLGSTFEVVNYEGLHTRGILTYYGAHLDKEVDESVTLNLMVSSEETAILHVHPFTQLSLFDEIGDVA